MFNPTIYTGTRHTAGLLDDVQSYVQKAITGGKAGDTDYDNRVALLGDAGGRAIQKFVQTPEGQSTVNKLAFEVGVPMLVLGLAIGWMIGRKKKAA